MINGTVCFIIIYFDHWQATFYNRIDICPKQIVIIKELHFVYLTKIILE